MSNALSNSQVIEAIGIDETVIEDLKTVQGTTFGARANQFLTALVNKIIYQRVADLDFTNPFAKFDSFPITYGDSIENIFVQTIRGHKYDPNNTNPFEKFVPNVTAHYVSINFEMQYIITIQDVLIRRACLNEYGMSNLIERILKSMRTTMEVDEYLATLYMLNNPLIYANSTQTTDPHDTFATIDLSQDATDADKAQHIAKTMIEKYKDMTLPSPDNNVAGVMTSSPRDRLLVICKQSIVNMINLDYLAGVYNLNKVELLTSIIEVRDFRVVVNDYSGETVVSSEDGEDVAFVIVDTDGFDNHRALEDGGMIYNPRGKYTNHFLNNFKILSYRPDYQAAAYVLDTGE